jgi:D-glycero-D-manno-heptose 1,7-bisphosphate phosphatase
VRPGVFIDRDDTLIDTTGATGRTPHPGDLTLPELVRLLPGVGESCRRLVDAGYVLVVVSNQGCVARDVASLASVHAVNQRLFDLLPAHKLTPAPALDHPHVSVPAQPSLLTVVYFCPFHPEGVVPEFAREHPWRKPAPGMIAAAAADLDIDLSRSWLIGDAQRDLDAGIGAGVSPVRCLLANHDFAVQADRILEGAGTND